MIFLKIYKSLLFLFTIFLLFLFVWFRFIKERLPFIIPYELSILSSLVLIGIISFYIYIIFSKTLKDINEFRREQMNLLILKGLSPILIYKVNNIKATAFKIVFYFLLILVPFITFSYVQFSNSDQFFLLNIYDFTFFKILKMYAIFIAIVFLFFLIKSLLSHELIKLHYFLYRYRIYFDTIDSMRMYNLTIFNPLIRRIDFILKKDIDRY